MIAAAKLVALEDLAEDVRDPVIVIEALQQRAAADQTVPVPPPAPSGTPPRPDAAAPVATPRFPV